MDATIERSPARKLSHVSVRLLAAINLADAAIEMVSPRYAHAVANGPLADVLVRWLIVSSFLLPVWVVFELFWMWEFEDEWRSLWIDAAFAFSWFLTFWLTIGYTFTHRVLFI
jgi:hypothetical protein